MNLDIHPEIKKFWEEQGYWVKPRFNDYKEGKEYNTMFWDMCEIGTKGIKYTIAFIAKGGIKEYYWPGLVFILNVKNKFPNGPYSEEDMLKLIKLKSFM